MVFSTYVFMFCFLPVVLVGYYALLQAARSFRSLDRPVSRWRNQWLLLMSYVFYGWWNPWFILLMMFVTVACYLSGRIISSEGADSRRRHWGLALALVSSLGPLAFFKYFTFLQVNLNVVLKLFGADAVRVLQIFLPAGISFYCFHALSYALDLYRGTAPPARSLSDFACYIALFPQLVAGPIIRYNTVAEQFVNRSHTWDKFASGAALFGLGLAKKVLLANPVGQVADAAFAARSLTAPDAWFGVVAYAFQIYFDFAGYSDMAIGLGRMIGFQFLKNFDAPYRSESITEFWRRWHISLSKLLRDYLYLPLGGNRKGPGRTYVNLAIVMLLGGLWHGAAWNFVVWGGYHGSLLAFERSLGKQSPYHGLPRPVRVGLTFVLVLISWVLFRAETLGYALRYLGAMLGLAAPGGGGTLLPSLLYSQGTIVLMTLCTILAFGRQQAHEWCDEITWPKAAVLVPLTAAAVMVMFSQAFSPFLYFQF
jgi:alginate O-acetyltransferase complex protein AlgI